MVKAAVKFAWLIQFDIFIMLILFTPQGPWRLPALISYILASSALVIWVRRQYRYRQ